MLLIEAFLAFCLCLHRYESAIANNQRDADVHFAGNSYEVSIDGSEDIGKLNHFWRSTGFCPPRPHQGSGWWFLGMDMQQNLQYIGAIPNSGVQQVRIHWLLDLVTVKSITDGKVDYDFSELDELMDNLRKNQLKPGFEIMGNPSSIFTDLENKTQVYMWKDLVMQVASRYVDRYGLDYVKTWHFETWNEPDHQKEYDLLKFNVQSFNNYYDACSEGLRAVSSELILGGPGASCRDADFSQICWGLLDHVDSGYNFFTGDKHVRIDYISFHNKGLPPQNSRYILKTDVETAITIHHLHPRLINVSIVNDEADPLVGWSDLLWWRADATYAAMVVKVITQHQHEITLNPDLSINYGLLSNDNGFLSYQPNVFSQRTLVARFQINNTMQNHTEMIRKPVHSVMGLLSLLGENQLKVNITDGFYKHEPDGDIGAMATWHQPISGIHSQDSWQAAVILYSSMDSNPGTANSAVKLTISQLKPPSDSALVMVRYALDNKNGNPFRFWNQSGQPATPNWKVLMQMRQNQDPIRVFGPEAVSLTSSFSMTFNLPLPGVSLIHVCAKADLPPNQPTDLTLTNITAGKVLIRWSDENVNSKCVLSYEVEFSRTAVQGPYHRINTQDSMVTIFLYSPDPSSVQAGMDLNSLVKGFYRVRVVDYFNRTSNYTDPVKL